MVAVLASEDERWREDQRSTVTGPVSVSEEDRRSSAGAEKADAYRPGRSLRPGERELRRQAAAGSVDDDVHVVRRPGAAGAEALTGSAGRRVRRQSGRGADLKDPRLGSAGVAPERDPAQAAVGADRDRSAGGRAGEAGRTTRLRIRSDRHPAWTGHANQREPSADRQRSRRRGAQRDRASRNVRLMRPGAVPGATSGRGQNQQRQRDQPDPGHISTTVSQSCRVPPARFSSKRCGTSTKSAAISREPNRAATALGEDTILLG
jgi:hypothetical protein